MMLITNKDKSNRGRSKPVWRHWTRKAAVAAGAALLFMHAPLVLADYSAHPEAKRFVDEMVKNHKFDRQTLVGLFQQAEKKDKILESIAKPAEKVLTWADYSRIFMTQERIQDGRKFMQEHRETLQRAEATYGVPPQIIVAILGVETKYGRVQGTYRVLDALSTLAFDYPPRAKFFRAELEQFLLMTREQGFDPLSKNGSYAGAMGYGQFIPSSFRRYAVDFDNDKVADIWANPVDAIGSVANYFHKKGWKDGGPLYSRVQVEGSQYRKFLQKGLKPSHTVADLKKAGVKFEQSVSGSEPALLLELEGPSGQEHWVGFHNFYVITRYNISHLYAMAVSELSREILNEPSNAN